MSGSEDYVARFIDDLDPKQTALELLLQRIKPSGSIHVIISTGSGAGSAQVFYDTHLAKLLSKFELKDGEYSVHTTQNEQSVSHLAESVFAQEASNGRYLLIVVLSGDGGVIDILNGLTLVAKREGYRAPYIAVLPFGTANALAHSAHVASDDSLGLTALVHGQPKDLPNFLVRFSPGAKAFADEARQKVDLPAGDSSPLLSPAGKAIGNDRLPTLYGAVVCSWGFHAAIVADSDTAEFRKHGLDRFKMAANEALHPADGKGPHQYMGEVHYKQSGKWQAIDRDAHGYVLATTVSNLEKTFTISPASKQLDGSLRLVHFGSLPGDKVMSIMMQAYQQGKHVEADEVGYEDIDGLWIDFKEDEERWRRVCVDGKIVAVEKGGWVSVEKNSTPVLELLVPVG